MKYVMLLPMTLSLAAPLGALAQTYPQDNAARANSVTPIDAPSTWISSQDILRVSPDTVTSPFVRVIFDVLGSGKVANCRSDISSGNIELDSSICLSLELRGRYRVSDSASGEQNRTRVSAVFWINKKYNKITINDWTVKEDYMNGAIISNPDMLIALPNSDPGRWVYSSDYPKEARKSRSVGTVGFLVKVSRDGVPASCLVLKSSGTGALDNATCRVVMQRARFHPPKDLNGKSSDGYFVSSINWSL
ncbi:TonB/TolA, C-terminal [Sphingomonadaceae bacterium]